MKLASAAGARLCSNASARPRAIAIAPRTTVIQTSVIGWGARRSRSALFVDAGMADAEAPANVLHLRALEARLRVLRMRLEPGGVAVGQRRSGQTVSEDRQPDRNDRSSRGSNRRAANRPLRSPEPRRRSTRALAARTIRGSATVGLRAPVPIIAAATGAFGRSSGSGRRTERSTTSRPRAPARAARRRKR